MQKVVVLFLLFIISNPALKAQERFSIGLTGGYGLNNTFFNGTALESAISSKDITWGVVFQHMTNKHLGVQIELRYATKGIGLKIEQASDPSPYFGPILVSPTTIYERQIGYIVLPVMSHFELGKKNFKVIINVGPQLNFTSNNWYGQSYNLLDSTYLRINEKLRHEEQPHNWLMFGFAFGLGFSYNFPFGIIQAEARVEQSITSIMPAGKYNTFYNQYLGAQVSYLYTFKQKPLEVAPVEE